MNPNFLLMRHAQSKHNQQKAKWKSQHNSSKFKDTKEYKRLKFNPQLLDSNVILHSDVQRARQLINLDKIELIITSPLRRCLQTCAQLINAKKTMFHVIVEPLLNSRLSSAWSVGTNANTLKQQYPTFDFNAFSPFEQVWMLKFLQNIRKIDSNELQQNSHRGQQYLLELLSQKKEESYRQFFLRSRRLKKRIRQIVYSTKLKDIYKNEVLIISHSCVLNCLLGKQINSNGKVKEKIQFEHCNPKRFTSQQVFGSTQVIKPKL